MLKVCILKRKEKNPQIQKDIKKIWYINLISFSMSTVVKKVNYVS